MYTVTRSPFQNWTLPPHLNAKSTLGPIHRWMHVQPSSPTCWADFHVTPVRPLLRRTTTCPCRHPQRPPPARARGVSTKASANPVSPRRLRGGGPSWCRLGMRRKLAQNRRTFFVLRSKSGPFMETERVGLNVDHIFKSKQLVNLAIDSYCGIVFTDKVIWATWVFFVRTTLAALLN